MHHHRRFWPWPLVTACGQHPVRQAAGSSLDTVLFRKGCPESLAPSFVLLYHCYLLLLCLLLLCAHRRCHVVFANCRWPGRENVLYSPRELPRVKIQALGHDLGGDLAADLVTQCITELLFLI